MKKFFRWLQERDIIWSVPFAFIGFWIYGFIQELVFGDPMYTTEWFHAALLSSLIMILFNGVIQLGNYFNFRGIYKYFYSQKSSIREDFKAIPSWLKISLYLFIYFLQMYALILIYKSMIA